MNLKELYLRADYKDDRGGLIYNCDCFELLNHMDDKIVDITFTSPPYNRARNDTYKFYDDNKINYFTMLKNVTVECLRVTKRNVIINIQQNHYNKVDFFNYLGEFSNKICGIVIWEKNNPVPAINYREKDNSYSITNAYEYFIILSDNITEFRAYNKIKNIFSTNVNTEHFKGHGAIMKREACEYIIDNFTKEKDVIFDPFMGLATTAITSIAKNRKYIGSELIKEYFDMSIKRIETEKGGTL